MRAEHVAIIVARGIGLGFVVMGATDAFYAFPFAGAAMSGWTSYSPSGSGTSTLNTSFSVPDSGTVSVVLPCLAQLIIGSAMILLGKPIGRWLAHGLKD